MKNNKEKKHKDIYKLYKKYLKENPNLPKIMEQFNIDEKAYLDALYQIESTREKPEKIYSDTTFYQ